jgi:hypothetical protein
LCVVDAAAAVEAGRAVIAGGNENALPLRGGLLEQRIDVVLEERRVGAAKRIADADGAATVVGHRAVDIGDQVAPQMVDDRRARRGDVRPLQIKFGL